MSNRQCLVIASMLLLNLRIGQSAIVYSNFAASGPDGTGGGYLLGSGKTAPFSGFYALAAAFVPTEDFELAAIRVPITMFSPVPNNQITIQLARGTSPAGAILESFAVTTDGFTTVEARSTVRPLLRAGERHWVVVVMPSGGGEWGWGSTTHLAGHVYTRPTAVSGWTPLGSGTAALPGLEVTGSPVQCVASIGYGFLSVPAMGDVIVRTPTVGPCKWAMTSDSGWIQVYPLTATGPVPVSVTVYPNFSSQQRTGRVLHSGGEITIVQDAATGTPDERFIGEMYFSAFGRIASPAEVAGHVANGRTPQDLVKVFLNVPEFHNASKFVAGLYVGILGRDPEYGGWLFQRNAMARYGASPSGLVANFLNSAEFQMKNPDITDADFVRLLYRQVLGREGTQAEIDFQVRNMNATNNRVNLATAFLLSDEYKVRVGPRLTGFLLHALLLQRDPTPAELSRRAEQLASGVDLGTVVQDLLGIRPQ